MRYSHLFILAAASYFPTPENATAESFYCAIRDQTVIKILRGESTAYEDVEIFFDTNTTIEIQFSLNNLFDDTWAMMASVKGGKPISENLKFSSGPFEGLLEENSLLYWGRLSIEESSISLFGGNSLQLEKYYKTDWHGHLTYASANNIVVATVNCIGASRAILNIIDELRRTVSVSNLD